MPISIKSSGTWRSSNGFFVKVAGVWRQALMWTKVAGVWRPVHQVKVVFSQNSTPSGYLSIYVNSVLRTPSSWQTAGQFLMANVGDTIQFQFSAATYGTYGLSVEDENGVLLSQTSDYLADNTLDIILTVPAKAELRVFAGYVGP